MAKGSSATLKRPANEQHRPGRDDDRRGRRPCRPWPRARRVPRGAGRAAAPRHRPASGQPRTAAGSGRPPTRRTSPRWRTGSPRARRTEAASAASAGPTMKPRSVMAPYSAVAAGSRSGLTRLGMAASDAGLNRPVPAPASSASATVAAKLSTRRYAEERRPAQRRPRRSGSCVATSGRPRRRRSGRADIAGTRSASRIEADRPRGVEALVGNDQERDVPGAVAERGLSEDRVVNAGHALVPE